MKDSMKDNDDDNSYVDFRHFRMKTLNIVIPEIIYDELYKKGLIRKINELVVNHLIDVLDELDRKDKM